MINLQAQDKMKVATFSINFSAETKKLDLKIHENMLKTCARNRGKRT